MDEMDERHGRVLHGEAGDAMKTSPARCHGGPATAESARSISGASSRKTCLKSEW